MERPLRPVKISLTAPGAASKTELPTLNQEMGAMAEISINWPAVVAAALAGFAIGGLWYSPLLIGNLWMEEAGVTHEQINGGNKAKIFGGAFVSLLIMSYCLDLFIGLTTDVSAGFHSPSQQGAFYGFCCGAGWILFALVVVGLFEHRSWKYMAINGGYWVVTMTTMGGILGGWN